MDISGNTNEFLALSSAILSHKTKRQQNDTSKTMMPRNPQQSSKKEPVPDVPQLRSVLIRSPSSFGVPAPRSLSAAPKIAPSLKTINTSKTNGPWKLEKSQLLPLPEVYPLERSHVYIETLNVQDVATNIAECLRKESIAAVFDSSKVRAPPRDSN